MNGNSLTVENARPTNVRWCVFSLAFATSALLYLHRYVFGFIKPILAKEWGLTTIELGEIDTAFSVCYTGFQFPLAVCADAFGVHLVMTGLMIVWMSGLAIMSSASSFVWMWYAQAVLGAGQSAVYACISRIANTWFPPAIRTTLQGVVGILAGRLGALGASLIFTTLMLGMWGLDWRTALWIHVASGVVLIVLFAVLFRSTPRQHPRANLAEAELIEGATGSTVFQPPAVSGRITVRQMLRTVSPRSFLNLMFLSVQSLLSTFADNVFSNWIPLFLFQVHHLEFKKMGIYAALPLLGGAVSGLVGGILNDYLIAATGNRRWTRVAIGCGGKGMAAVLLFLAFNSYDDPYLFCIYLFWVKLFSDCGLTTAWGVVTDIGGRATASVFALNNSIAGIGQIVAPIIFATVAEFYGWRSVFVLVIVAYVLCAISWLFINCTIPVLGEVANAENDAETP